MPFTEKERKSIIERDLRFGRRDNPTAGCNFPHRETKIECVGRLEVHHILAETYGTIYLEKLLEELNQVINAITICQNSNSGAVMQEKYCIYPDQMQALIDYQNGDKEAYNKMQEERILLAKAGVIYWNTSYDTILSVQAQKNTLLAERNGWEFEKRGTVYRAKKRLSL